MFSMPIRNSLKNLRNTFDFSLRNKIALGLAVKKPLPIDLEFQTEMESFLNLFPWKDLLKGRAKTLKIADIGARNFALAPLWDRFFRKLGFEPETHGIEIDPNRRLTNLRTRGDYGRYYAQSIPCGRYHTMDYLEWAEELDIAMHLNPFVTIDPLLAWGLPLKYFEPKSQFKHTQQLLSSRHGILVMSNPNIEEYQTAVGLATEQGFTLRHEKPWRPRDQSSLKRSRFGSVFTF